MGSLCPALPAVLLHASYNVAYIMYPCQGSHYDPIILPAVLWIPGAIVLLRWVAPPRRACGRGRHDVCGVVLLGTRGPRRGYGSA